MNTAKRLEYTEYINSTEWKHKREEAFKHYGKKCAHCGSENLLHVHHNTYENFKHEQMKDLNILCEVCHMSLHDRINKRTVMKTGVVKTNKKSKNKPVKKKDKPKNKPSNKPHRTMLDVIASINATIENKRRKQDIKWAERFNKKT